MVQTFSPAQIKAPMVSVLVITVALFQRRHNARCTTLEWLESMVHAVQAQHLDALRIAKRERFRDRPRGWRHSPALHVGRVARLRQPAYPPIPGETRFRPGASQTLIEDWH